jgi:hypothetical protein
VLRRNKETLLTLLEAFVYDPLVDWSTDKSDQAGQNVEVRRPSLTPRSQKSPFVFCGGCQRTCVLYTHVVKTHVSLIFAQVHVSLSLLSSRVEEVTPLLADNLVRARTHLAPLLQVAPAASTTTCMTS